MTRELDCEFAEWFGGQVRGARKAAGLSPGEAARRAQIHPTDLAEIEGGLRTPDLAVAMRLASALCVTPQELMGGARWDSGRSRYEFDPERANKWNR